MKIRDKDPLLAFTHIILTSLLVVFAIVFATLLIGAATLPLPFVQNHISTLELAPGATSGQYAARLAVGILLALLFVANAFIFLLNLRRIVQSVADGDPFPPENAKRLHWMGLTTLGIVICSVIQPHAAEWVNELLSGPERVIVYNVSADGLLLALILFILARVFRHGAEMREDLEGTV